MITIKIGAEDNSALASQKAELEIDGHPMTVHSLRLDGTGIYAEVVKFHKNQMDQENYEWMLRSYEKKLKLLRKYKVIVTEVDTSRAIDAMAGERFHLDSGIVGVSQ